MTGSAGAQRRLSPFHLSFSSFAWPETGVAILALGLCYGLHMTRSKLNLSELTKAERRDEPRQRTAKAHAAIADLLYRNCTGPEKAGG